MIIRILGFPIRLALVVALMPFQLASALVGIIDQDALESLWKEAWDFVVTGGLR